MSKTAAKPIALLLALCFTLTACASGENNNLLKDYKNNSVDDILASRAQDQGATVPDLMQESKASEPTSFNFQAPDDKRWGKALSREELDKAKSDDVDFDLSTMNKDVVYAIVFRMMNNPEEFLNKTFRMEGLYYANYYEPHERYYSFCIVEDATACCAQGLLFVMEDESLSNPEDFPEDYSRIVIEGKFTGLELPAEKRTQYRLLVNKMEVINGPEEGGYRLQ